MIGLLVSFHQKLLVPTLCTAVGIGIAGYFMVWSTPIDQGAGFGYIFAGPLTQFFFYDLRNPNEYYFYFNKGLSKCHLYLSSLVLNSIVGIIILSYA